MRFRPRFSLRTLLVSIFCIAFVLATVAWQKRIVDRRKKWLADPPVNYGCASGERPKWELPIPFIRRMLGDKYYRHIDLERASPDQMAAARELFPEARIGTMGTE
jgi:hypothetical protein